MRLLLLWWLLLWWLLLLLLPLLLLLLLLLEALLWVLGMPLCCLPIGGRPSEVLGRAARAEITGVCWAVRGVAYWVRGVGCLTRAVEVEAVAGRL
jgi:hypothetical protein